MGCRRGKCTHNYNTRTTSYRDSQYCAGYRFALSVTNAPVYAKTQHGEWAIKTYTKSGSAVDGSFATVAWNPRDKLGNLGVDSWAIYRHHLSQDMFKVFVSEFAPL